MSKIKNLIKFSAIQLKEFLSSFDVVFSDIDGVIWNYTSSIDGALESLISLKKSGKEVYLVTNNNMRKVEYLAEKLQCGGFQINPDHIINSSKAIIWYLKKINFQGDVFAITSDVSRTDFQEAGIQIVEQPKIFPTDERATVNELLDRPSVKAVIVDFDMNCNWVKIASAISCLKREEVIYLEGSSDTWVGEKNFRILGFGPILDLISNHSGKKPIACSKPSQVLKDYIFDTCNVKNPQRCLFIGDKAEQDMKFASMCGFLKLFVDSGCDTLEETLKEENTCPDYYIPSLGQLFFAFQETQNQYTANHENIFVN